MKSKKQQEKLRLIMPKPEVFEMNVGAAEIANPTVSGVKGERYVFMFDHVEYPKEGGIWCWNKGVKYPSRTLPFVQALFLCDIAKRNLLGEFRLMAKDKLFLLSLLSKKNLNEWVRKYVEQADQTLKTIYYKPSYYSAPALEVWKFVQMFLDVMGVELKYAAQMGKILATMIEHDNAYRWRIQDLAGETNPLFLSKMFPKEFSALIEIYRQRDPAVYNVQKIEAIGKIIRFAWWLPRFRKAVREGIWWMSWDKLTMDKNDLHYAFMQRDYDTLGLPFEERKRRFIAEYGDDPKNYPQMLHIPAA